MKWLGLAVLAAVLGVMTYGFLGMHVTSCGHSGRREDTNNLKNIAGLLLHGHSDRNLPLRDGALDVYLLVRNGDIYGSNLKILRSVHTGKGPTDEEIARGDYTNFPWERYRGDGNLEGPPFPLLWERKPDAEGRVLVGLSDGTVTTRR